MRGQGGREFHAAVHRLAAPDPEVAARRVTQEVGADAAADPGTAEWLVRARVEAGRVAFGGDPDRDAGVLGRREAILEAASLPPAIAEVDVAELRRLADDLGRAARIRQRTEARFVENLEARVARSAGITLHPTALREAATAVAEAEDDLAAAEAARDELGPDPGEDDGDVPLPVDEANVEPGVVDLLDLLDLDPDDIDSDGLDPGAVDPVLDEADDQFDEATLELRRSWTRAVAVVAVAVGGGLIQVGVLGSSPAFFVMVVVLGLLLATLEILRGRRAARWVEREAEAEEVQADHLASVRSAVESTTSGQAVAALTQSAAEGRAAWLDARVTADARCDEGDERLRVARNRWHQLAGPEAAPEDVEAIVHTHDPQLAFGAAAVESSPTVRTVAAFHRKAQARWKVLWAALGQDHPPAAADLEAELDNVLGDHRRAIAEARLLADAETRVSAAEVLRRPIVFVRPSAWLAPHQLDQLLASVPPEGRVIVIEPLDANGPAEEAGPDEAVGDGDEERLF